MQEGQQVMHLLENEAISDLHLGDLAADGLVLPSDCPDACGGKR